MGTGTTTSTRTDVGVDVEALYERHWRPMVRMALLLVDDVAAAEDVVQDAFVALHRRAHRLREPAAALGYLRTSVVNGARSQLRRRGVARRHLSAVVTAHAEPADRPVIVAAEHAELMAALASLPGRQREVIVLRYWMHLSEAEIAGALGISKGTVKSSAAIRSSSASNGRSRAPPSPRCPTTPSGRTSRPSPPARKNPAGGAGTSSRRSWPRRPCSWWRSRSR